MKNRVEKAIEFIPCPTCKAKPKKKCTTRSGNEYAGTWFAHEPRVAPFAEEYWKGVWHGEDVQRRYYEATQDA